MSELPVHCGGPYALGPENTIEAWEDAPTTREETAVQAYLRDRPSLVHGASMLHIGVGNGSLFEAFGAELAVYVGVTISLPEVRHFEADLSTPESTVLLADKYDVAALWSLPRRFDLIVDVNLRSYACCETHFSELMAFYADRLGPGAILITAQSGMSFGWLGNTGVAYTPALVKHPASAQARTLDADALGLLAEQHGLDLQSTLVSGVEHFHGSTDGQALCSDELLWILTRPAR